VKKNLNFHPYAANVENMVIC